MVPNFLFLVLLGFPFKERIVLFGLRKNLFDINCLQILTAVALYKVFVPPNLKGEVASVFFFFSLYDGFANPVTQVFSRNKGLAIHPREHISKEKLAFRGRTFAGALHLYLVAAEPADHDTQDSSRAKTPRVGAFLLWRN